MTATDEFRHILTSGETQHMMRLWMGMPGSVGKRKGILIQRFILGRPQDLKTCQSVSTLVGSRSGQYG